MCPTLHICGSSLRSEEDLRFLGTRVTGSCKPAGGELHSSSLQEKEELFTFEPSLQPQNLKKKNNQNNKKMSMVTHHNFSLSTLEVKVDRSPDIQGHQGLHSNFQARRATQ